MERKEEIRNNVFVWLYTRRVKYSYIQQTFDPIETATRTY